MYRIPSRRALLSLFSTFGHNYRSCAAVYARPRGLRLISTLSLTPRRPSVTQNRDLIQTRRTFSLETTTGSSEPKLESSSMETLNGNNTAATTSANIEKSHASDDSSHDVVITSSTDVEKSHVSGDLSHDVVITSSTDVEKSHASGDSSHDIVITSSTDVEKSHASGDSSHDVITSSTDVEKSHESGDSSHDTDVEKSHASGDLSHEVEGTSCDSEVDPSLASDERYAYLQKGFTTEIYKIEICNLPPFLGYQVPANNLQPRPLSKLINVYSFCSKSRKS